MKKRKSIRNDIAMSYRIESLGFGRRRVSKVVFLRIVLAWLRGDIAELPRGWNITWLWRNSAKSALRSDTIENTVANSRDAFVGLMERRIERDLNALGFTTRGHTGKKRKHKARQFKKAHHRKRPRKVSKVRRKKSKRAHTRKRHKNS